MNRVAKRHQKTLARRATRKRNDGPTNGFGISAGAVPARQISELLQTGVQLHQAGRLQDAEPVYRQILDIDPGHADANHLLGGLAHQAGDYVQAAKLISKALANAPGQPLFHYNLGNALRESGRLDDAVASYRKALGIEPSFTDAHNHLGIALRGLGRLDDAVASHRNALAIQPEFAEAHYNLGIALQGLGRLNDAMVRYRKALAIKPDYAEAHCNLGSALQDWWLLEDAVASYRNAVAIKPDFTEAHYNLGNALQGLGRLDDAVASYRKALAIQPNLAAGHANLGTTLKKLGRFQDAIASCHKALAIKPDFAKVHGILGNTLLELGQLKEAVASFHEALSISPDIAEIWANLKLVTKALQFSESQGGRPDRLYIEGLSPAAQASTDYALFEYYLDRYRPQEAEERFRKAMAALPPKAAEEVTDNGKDRGSIHPPHIPDKLVALLHFGRSGTGFLHGLIDGHPEISTIPSIYLRGFFNAGVWERLAADGWRGLPERFADEFAVLFDSTSPKPIPSMIGDDSSYLGLKEGMTTLGENGDESISVDRDKFCAEAVRLMRHHERIDPRLFLSIVHGAFEKAIGTETEKHTIFYHIHNPEDFAKLNFLRFAPDARLVMMVREPIQSCESWIRTPFQENDYNNVALRIGAMVSGVDAVEFRTQDSIGVRLEDLKMHPKATMQALCAWMGVNETPSLYETTAQGKKWWGDRSSPDYEKSKAKSPFDQAPIKRAVGKIFSEKDLFVLRTLFYPFSVRFRYREPDPIEFSNSLREIRPLLDDMLDFERVMSERPGADPAKIKRSGAYMVLRAGLLDRWEVLNEFGDYPYMLTPLDIDAREDGLAEPLV